MDRGASFSGTEAAMLPEAENEPFRPGSNISQLGHLASFVVGCSSGELLKGKSGVVNLEGGVDAAGDHQKDPNSLDSALPPVVAGSMQMCRESTFSEQDEASNKDRDTLSPEKRNAKLPTETSYVECEIVGNVVIASGSEFDNTSGINPVNHEVINFGCLNNDSQVYLFFIHLLSFCFAALEDTNLVSHDILDGAPLLSGNGTSAEKIIDYNEQKAPALVVEHTHMGKKEELEVEIPAEVSLSALKECSQVESQLGSISEGPLFEVEKGSSHDSAVPMLSETLDRSMSMLETCNRESHGEQAMVAREVQECSRNVEVYSVPRGPVVKEGDDPGAEDLENHKEMTGKNHEAATLKVAADVSADHQASSDLACVSECDANCMLEGGGISAESDKTSCDSPIVFSCPGLSHSENYEQEGLKGAVAGNVSLSEVAEKAQAISPNLKENDASIEERSFTFEVSPAVHLSQGGTCKIVEGSPLTSGAGQADPKTVHEISRVSPQVFDRGTVRGGAKDTSARKTRRASGKPSAKDNSKKRNTANEIALVIQTDRGNKSCSMPMIPFGTGQFVQFEELKHYGDVECSGAKPSVVVSIPTSNLPDLNTSAPLSALFQQPFTDLQQVQLRAQIFVYGSLIQGAVPDEACMTSAIGPSDGGRSLWEPAWRACIDRVHGQKSRTNNSATPVQSHSGARVPDQPTKQSSLQNKSLSSSFGRASIKGTPSPVVNPIIPLSSPLWNMSTPSCDGLQSSGMPRGALFDYHQALSHLLPFQTAPIRNSSGHSNSWLSQAPFAGPWVGSPQPSGFDFSAHFSVLPSTETVKLTSVKESSVPISSGINQPIPVAHSGSPSVLAGTSSPLDVKKVTASPGKHSADPKTRKRKKVSVSEDLDQVSLLAKTQSESMSTPVVGSHLPIKVPVGGDIGQISLPAQGWTKSFCAPFVTGHFSTAVAVTAPSCFVSKSSSAKSLTAVSPAASAYHPQIGDQNAENGVIITQEPFTNVEDAKVQAEDAVAHAAAAVSQCEGVWSQLVKQKNSGLSSDVEAKLASAAVAIAAAASVAKAAAAAAKIASNAAIQAKLMADEALVYWNWQCA
ncbi:unnamed protein product [Ilex paraguariensis]|uniref:Uncharacterized protein n=1 Tax=Ilex paraguariensis TaxID=185542 RepID=A0ABC8ULP1_9AQUA